MSVSNASKHLSEDILQLGKWLASNKLTVKMSNYELLSHGTNIVPSLEKRFGEESPGKNLRKFQVCIRTRILRCSIRDKSTILQSGRTNERRKSSENVRMIKDKV